jgi:hypothetical protein
MVRLAAGLGRLAFDELHRPRAVRPLVAGQPVVPATRLVPQPGDGQRHQALDVVPRVDVSLGPRYTAVLLLEGGDAVGGLEDLVGGDDSGDGGQPRHAGFRT